MKNDITMEMVQTKLDNGESLSSDEKLFVMGDTPDEDVEEESSEESSDESSDDSENTEESSLDNQNGFDGDGEYKPSKEKTQESSDTDAKETPDTIEEINTSDTEKKEPEIIEDEEKEREYTSKLSKKERGFYYDKKRALRRAQEAESKIKETSPKLEQLEKENDTLKFQVAKLEGRFEKIENPESTVNTVPTEEELIEEESPLPKKAVRQIVDDRVQQLEHQNIVLKSSVDEIYARAKLSDYDDVINFGQDLNILQSNTEHLQKIGKAYKEGQNVALVAYEIIKKDPKFQKYFVKKEISKQKSNEIGDKQKQIDKKIEENKNKTKVSGATPGSDAVGEGAITVDRVRSMKPSEFMKLSAAKRKEILRMI